MAGIAVEKTRLDGVLIVTPRWFSDVRGDFCETYNADTFAGIGVDTLFVQDNHSRSVKVGTVRGLHFQAPPKAQAKLVRVLQGAIFDVVVDARRGSPTRGEWVGVELSRENGRQLLVPVGFLHGFVTREPNTEVAYKCSAPYAPDLEGGVRFDDPDLAIDWGFDPEQAILSPRDAASASWKSLESPFEWEAKA